MGQETTADFTGVVVAAGRAERFGGPLPKQFLEIEGRDPSRLRSQGDHGFVPQSNDFSRVTFVMEDGRATGLSLHECVPTEQSRCRNREGSQVN